MSDRRYINLQVTPQKWENQYYGDFEAPIALYPAPSRPTPSPTRTPTPTPTPSVTPSITPTGTPAPSKTPTVTPTSSPIPVTPSITPTQSATPSVTPTQTITPTASITPTPSITPTFTPTPSSTPLPQYFILAEDTAEILTEGADNLITQDGASSAQTINMGNFEQGTRIQVTNNDTSSDIIDASVTQDTYTSSQGFTGKINLDFTWTKLVGTDELYRINVYELEGGVRGRLLEQSSASSSGSYTYTGNTDVYITASVLTTNGRVLNKTSSVSGGNFSYLGQTWYVAPGSTQWGIDGITPWGSNEYHTGIITPSDPGLPQYKMIFVRTSLAYWTRYTYTVPTKIWSNPQNIATGTSNYGTQDQSTLVDNL